MGKGTRNRKLRAVGGKSNRTTGYAKEHQRLKYLLGEIRSMGINAVGASSISLGMNVEDYRQHLMTEYTIKEPGINKIKLIAQMGQSTWNMQVWAHGSKHPVIIKCLDQLGDAAVELDKWLIRLAQARAQK